MLWMTLAPLTSAWASICPIYDGTSVGPTFPVDAQLVVFHPMPLEGDPLWYTDAWTGEYPLQTIESVGRNYSEVVWVDRPRVGDVFTVRGETVEIVAGGDRSAPAAPQISSVGRTRYEMPKGTNSLDIDVELDADASWVEVEVARSEDFGDALRFGGIPPLYLSGDSPCSTYWPEHRPRAGHHVRARQVDQTGNRSPWSDPVSLPAKGCSTQGVAVPWLATAVLGIVRRR